MWIQCPFLVVSILLALLSSVSASSAYAQKINSNIRSAHMYLSNAQAELLELSETFDETPLFGPKTLLSAHWYLSDVTDVMRAYMKDGRLVFPDKNTLDPKHAHEPANVVFGNPFPDQQKALVVTWIDENFEFQKRAFKQADIQSPSQWGCKLWEE